MDYHDSNDGNFAFHYPKQKKIEPHFGGAFLLDEFQPPKDIWQFKISHNYLKTLSYVNFLSQISRGRLVRPFSYTPPQNQSPSLSINTRAVRGYLLTKFLH